MKISQIIISFCLACILLLTCATQAIAFCGFYVGGADAKLFNQASQVVIARKGDRTILKITKYLQQQVITKDISIPTD